MTIWKDDTGRMSWFGEALLDALAATFTVICTMAFAFLENPAHALLTICALAFAFMRVLNGLEEYRYRKERRKRFQRFNEPR